MEVRFTPTRVGKTAVALEVRKARSVHPHAGGENGHVFDKLVGLGRFTPTRVGKTHIEVRGVPVRAVHPHAGGEN